MTVLLLVLFVLTGPGPWILAVIELFASRSFVPFFFELGIPVYRATMSTDFPDLKFPENKTIRKKQGTFRFMDTGKVYFLSRPEIFRASTPFFFKAVAVLDRGIINIRARVPLGTALFLLFWTIGWIGGFMAIGFVAGPAGGLILGLVGSIFPFFLFIISYPLEKKRMRKMVAELEEIVEEL